MRFDALPDTLLREIWIENGVEYHAWGTRQRPAGRREQQQLYVLYAVIDRTVSAALWVADPNPPAQTFYRKHGFLPDGAVRTDDDVRELGMVRAINTADAPLKIGDPDLSLCVSAPPARRI